MTWADDLMKAAHDLGFDLDIKLSTHTNGCQLFSWTSNLTWDNKRIDHVNACAKSAKWMDGKTPRFIYAVPDKR